MLCYYHELGLYFEMRPAELKNHLDWINHMILHNGYLTLRDIEDGLGLCKSYEDNRVASYYCLNDVARVSYEYLEGSNETVRVLHIMHKSLPQDVSTLYT